MRLIYTKAVGKRYVVSQNNNEELPVMEPRAIDEASDLEEYTEEDLQDAVIDDQLKEEEYENKIEDFEEDKFKEETPDNYPVFNNKYEAMRWAVDNKEKVRISYTTLSGIGLIRDVEPHALFFARTTRNNILGTWDENAEGIKSYILDNISSYQFLGDKFTIKFIFKG